MARVQWKHVWDIMCAMGWERECPTWATLARRMGITESHLSDVRSGRRLPSMAFVDLLLHALRLDSYDRVLSHPTMSGEPSAREVFGHLTLDDERPWPVGELKHGEPITNYGRHQKEKLLVQQLAALKRRPKVFA